MLVYSWHLCYEYLYTCGSVVFTMVFPFLSATVHVLLIAFLICYNIILIWSNTKARATKKMNYFWYFTQFTTETIALAYFL